LLEEVTAELMKITKPSKNKKGRALSMLGKKDLNDIKRKRKRQYSPYKIVDTNNLEEEKEYRQTKRHKNEEEVAMNVDTDQMKTIWELQQEETDALVSQHSQQEPNGTSPLHLFSFLFKMFGRRLHVRSSGASHLDPVVGAATERSRPILY
jgi:hypothetical protein